MKPKRTALLLLICLFVLATAHSEAHSQKRQGVVRDSLASSGAAKSTASKSYTQKSYERKQGAEFQNLKYSRMYAASNQCAFETNKGLRCKRKAQSYSRFCRQHEERFAVKDGMDKRK
jgi:hypothetical protein